MRHAGLIAFGITTCVLVPAAVNSLTAGREQVAKLFAPGEDSLVLDGAKVSVSLDRSIADQGDVVHVKLTASEAKTKRLALGVLVLGSSGDEGSRVPSPPSNVMHETVTLDVDRHGRAEKTIAVRLKGARVGFTEFATYTVLVMAPKAADRLETLRSKTRLLGAAEEGIPWYNKSGEKFRSLYWAAQSDDPSLDGERAADQRLFAAGTVARLEARTRPVNKAIALAAPATARRGEPFHVVVTVTNTTRKTLKDITVSLENPSGSGENGYLGVAATFDSEGDKFDLAPGASKRVTIGVTAAATGVVGLYARAQTDDWNAALQHGTFDATEIVETPPVVGSR